MEPLRSSRWLASACWRTWIRPPARCAVWSVGAGCRYLGHALCHRIGPALVSPRSVLGSCRRGLQKLLTAPLRVAQALWGCLAYVPRLVGTCSQRCLQPVVCGAVRGLRAGPHYVHSALSQTRARTRQLPSTALERCRQAGRDLREALANVGESIVERPLSAPHLAGKIAYLALLGFMVIILAGPVLAVTSVILSLAIAIVSMGLAVLSILLPFALIGFLVWLPCHVVGRGQGVPWPRMRQGIQEFVQAVFGLVHGTLVHGFACLRRLCWGSIRLGHAGQEGLRGLASLSKVLLLETVSGALVGGSMGLMLGHFDSTPFTHTAVAVGTLTGAYLGILVGLSTARRMREEELGWTLEELN